MNVKRPALAVALLMAAVLPRVLPAQEFIPPDRPPAQPQQPQPGATPSGFIVGVLGFSTRAGAQINADNQVVLGSTIDIAQLGIPGLRLRPSFEVGFARPDKSLALNLEAVYRFTDDDAQAIPYIGAGIGYYDNSVTKKGWPTFVLGFELQYSRTMSWLLEFHALDGVDRSRILIGLATRGGAND
jgi:hypothetical protein